MDKGIILNSLQSISEYISIREKRVAIGNFLLLLLSSVLDVFGLASLVPLIMAASDPNIIKTNKYMSLLYNLFGFQSYKFFLVFLIVGVFVYFLLKNLFLVWINHKQNVFTASIAINMIKRQYDKFLNLPYWHFNHIGSAGLINNIYQVPLVYVSGIIRPLYIFFSELIMIAVIVIGILLYQPILVVLLVVILLPSTLLTYNALKNKTANIGKRLNELRPVSHKLIMNTFNGFVEFKLANRLEQNKALFIERQKETQGLEAKAYLLSNIPLKMIEMVAILGIVTVFLYSIILPEYSGSLFALVGLFAAAAYRLMPSVNRLLTAMMMMKQNHYLINLLKEYKEFDRPLVHSEGQKSLAFNNSIVFENVSFAFPGTDKAIVKNINLKVNKGERVGFIGASGSGKTTLMNILLRFYIENCGQVLVDGVALTAENIVAWYDLIGYVKQDTFLMEGSIKDNITLASDYVDEKRLEYALRYASLYDFVEKLPNGINTEIGERGSKLSGGQKQRIGIARALYKNAKILVLDEATSALDNNTEREVSEAINKLADTDITIFMIAHRITTLRECDKIYELKDSEIIAEWNYHDLIKTVI